MKQFHVASYLNLLTKLIYIFTSTPWSQATLLCISVPAVKTQPCRVTSSLCKNPGLGRKLWDKMFVQLKAPLTPWTSVCSTAGQYTPWSRTASIHTEVLQNSDLSARAGGSMKFPEALRVAWTRKDPVWCAEDLKWWKKPSLAFLCCTHRYILYITLWLKAHYLLRIFDEQKPKGRWR